MRKLVTIETVLSVSPIADADAIEALSIRGWTVVAKKGEFVVGDRCVYFEIDSALPLSDERFAFLASRGTNTTLTGNKVHVLKTARLRGVYSQGLVIPLAAFPEFVDTIGNINEDSMDLASLLSVEKWEPPLPAIMGGDVLGVFPTHLARKTDAERVQNLDDVFSLLLTKYKWEPTEKLDGTSVTYINESGSLRVCGRNWELAAGANVYWETANRLKLSEQMKPGWVIQGEIYGEGIQANPLQIRGRHLGVFGFTIDRVPVHPSDWPSWLKELAVPIMSVDISNITTVSDVVAAVDGIRSTLAPDRLSEGIVFQTADRTEVPELDYRSCFKVISNKYLLKHQ
jgi:RNA ligase (TIGR02306 family)